MVGWKPSSTRWGLDRYCFDHGSTEWHWSSLVIRCRTIGEKENALDTLMAALIHVEVK